MTGREFVVSGPLIDHSSPPRRRRGRPTLYHPSMRTHVIRMGRRGMCREEIAAALDISHTTFSAWCRLYPEFLAAATRAKELEYAWWLRAGRKGQFQKGWNARGWALQMRNRFGDRFRIRDAESGDNAPQDAGALRADRTGAISHR